MADALTQNPTYSNSALYSNLGSKGRLRIYSDAQEITPINVVDELKKAIIPHTINVADIHTLFQFLPKPVKTNMTMYRMLWRS